jgi:hypothetical protein
MGLPTGGGGKKVAAAGGGPPKGGVGKRVATPKGTPQGGLGNKATLTSWFKASRESGARPGRGVYQGRRFCFLTAASLRASVTGEQGDGAAAGSKDPAQHKGEAMPSLGVRLLSCCSLAAFL